MVQWLRLHTFYIDVTGLIPSGGISNPTCCVIWPNFIYIYIKMKHCVCCSIYWIWSLFLLVEILEKLKFRGVYLMKMVIVAFLDVGIMIDFCFFFFFMLSRYSKMNLKSLCNIFLKNEAKPCFLSSHIPSNHFTPTSKVITQLFPPKTLAIPPLSKDTSEAKSPSSVFLTLFIRNYIMYLSQEPYLIC